MGFSIKPSPRNAFTTHTREKETQPNKQKKGKKLIILSNRIDFCILLLASDFCADTNEWRIAYEGLRAQTEQKIYFIPQIFRS